MEKDAELVVCYLSFSLSPALSYYISLWKINLNERSTTDFTTAP